MALVAKLDPVENCWTHLVGFVCATLMFPASDASQSLRMSGLRSEYSWSRLRSAQDSNRLYSEVECRTQPAEQETECPSNSNTPGALNQQKHNRNQRRIDVPEIVVSGVWIVEAQSENGEDRNRDYDQQRQRLTSRPAETTYDTDAEKKNKRQEQR